MEGYTSIFYSTALSLLPPVVAIVLALLFKEVYSALIAGVIVGAILYSNGNPGMAFQTMLFHENGGLVKSLSDESHVCILIFVVLLWTLVAAMNKSGSAAAFGNWAGKHIKTRVGAQIATVIMGLLIFVDDGFNCLSVGSVMRPVTDSHNVSRAKLAYLIDSTAAPICIIAPISSWAAAVSYSVPESMNINGFEMFLRTIPYNMYALGTIAMMFLLITTKTDYGPMRKHEENALKGDLFTEGEAPYEENQVNGKYAGNARVSNLVIPIVILILSCLTGMMYTGGFFEGETLRDSFANANSAMGMMMGSAVTLLLTFLLYLVRKVLTFREFMDCLPQGFRNVCAPMLILILAWTLSGMTGLLGADVFIHDLVGGFAAGLQMLLPMIIFLISVFLAFSTGTSWGTFTIMIPIVCAVFSDRYEMLVISISACLAGAVCGDHCSPISDTTIMSSAGAQCNHVNHTATQIPYAVTTAAVSAVGYLLAGILGYVTGNGTALVSLPVMLLLLAAVVFFIRKKEGSLV